jgi:hypothetical protein
MQMMKSAAEERYPGTAIVAHDDRHLHRVAGARYVQEMKKLVVIDNDPLSKFVLECVGRSERMGGSLDAIIAASRVHHSSAAAVRLRFCLKAILTFIC